MVDKLCRVSAFVLSFLVLSRLVLSCAKQAVHFRVPGIDFSLKFTVLSLEERVVE
jgi:hypothetical protein